MPQGWARIAHSVFQIQSTRRRRTRPSLSAFNQKQITVQGPRRISWSWRKENRRPAGVVWVLEDVIEHDNRGEALAVDQSDAVAVVRLHRVHTQDEISGRIWDSPNLWKIGDLQGKPRLARLIFPKGIVLSESAFGIHLGLEPPQGIQPIPSRLMNPSKRAIWWARRDLNPQPRDYESPALTVELQAPLFE